GWQFLQKRFKRKIDGLRGVEHGSKKLTHRTSPLIFKGLSAMLALMGLDGPTGAGLGVHWNTSTRKIFSHRLAS
ncbi:hypothetical protein, partial [uncultured Thiocystis sp.]|uniref:hypothetical protein n=1 Tax=uncultured Thiocystis sp. TaxID=1202134 RepID=UPI0025D7E61F